MNVRGPYLRPGNGLGPMLPVPWPPLDCKRSESDGITSKYLVCFMFSVLLSRSYLPPVVLSRSQKILRLPISRRSIIWDRMLSRTFLLVQVRRFVGLLPLRLWRESWVYRRSLDDQRQQDFFF